MKVVLIMLLALTLAGCATAGPGDAEREEREDARLFLGCTERGCSWAR